MKIMKHNVFVDSNAFTRWVDVKSKVRVAGVWQNYQNLV